MYQDCGCANNTWDNNIIYGGGELPFSHHCGIDNVSKNNIIHRTIDPSRPDLEPFHHFLAMCEKNSGDPQYFENTRNIYIFDNTDGFHFGRSWDRYYEDGLWGAGVYPPSPSIHHNIYWSLSSENDRNQPLFPGATNWSEWQNGGNETGSLWQDPEFEDPSNHRYVLNPESPAWALGIQQVDFDNIGIQTKE